MIILRHRPCFCIAGVHYMGVWIDRHLPGWMNEWIHAWEGHVDGLSLFREASVSAASVAMLWGQVYSEIRGIV